MSNFPNLQNLSITKYRRVNWFCRSIICHHQSLELFLPLLLIYRFWRFQEAKSYILLIFHAMRNAISSKTSRDYLFTRWWRKVSLSINTVLHEVVRSHLNLVLEINLVGILKRRLNVQAWNARSDRILIILVCRPFLSTVILSWTCAKAHGIYPWRRSLRFNPC